MGYRRYQPLLFGIRGVRGGVGTFWPPRRHVYQTHRIGASFVVFSFFNGMGVTAHRPRYTGGPGGRQASRQAGMQASSRRRVMRRQRQERAADMLALTLTQFPLMLQTEP